MDSLIRPNTGIYDDRCQVDPRKVEQQKSNDPHYFGTMLASNEVADAECPAKCWDVAHKILIHNDRDLREAYEEMAEAGISTPEEWWMKKAPTMEKTKKRIGKFAEWTRQRASAFRKGKLNDFVSKEKKAKSEKGARKRNFRPGEYLVKAGDNGSTQTFTENQLIDMQSRICNAKMGFGDVWKQAFADIQNAS